MATTLAGWNAGVKAEPTAAEVGATSKPHFIDNTVSYFQLLTFIKLSHDWRFDARLTDPNSHE